MVFDGFSRKAFTFYRDLEASNTKEFWHANKSTWEEFVQRPMEGLATELESEFGEAKLWRPQRDVRFSRDKSPYKTRQGLTFGDNSSVGYYLQLGAQGVHLGGGFHGLSREQISRYRDGVDDGRSGEALRRCVDELARSGWDIVGDRLKSRPRGVSADHPRLELLRDRKSVV